MEPVTKLPNNDHSDLPKREITPTEFPVSAVGVTAVNNDPHLPQVLHNSNQKKSSLLSRLFNGMSWYGLELALSVVGLLTTTSIMTYAIYALINYVKGIDNPMAVQFIGEFSLWIVASMIIWLPLAVICYLRTRAEVQRHPATKERLLHKLFVGWFMFHTVIVIAGTLFSVVYVMIRIMIGIDDQAGDTAVRIILPGVLAAALNIGLLWAYSRHETVSRKLFSLIVTGLGVAVAIALLGISITSVQGADRDQKTATDLGNIQHEIEMYKREQLSLPAALSDLDGLEKETKNRLSRYTYKKDGETKYQLCATFVTDTQKQQGYEASSSYAREYSIYVNFSRHGTGEKCFKITTDYSSFYNKYDYSDIDSPLGGDTDQSIY